MEKQKKNLIKKESFKLKKIHIIGIVAGLIIILISTALLFLTEFFDLRLFYFVFGIALVVAGLPFFTTLIIEGQEEQNKEKMFLEFSRDLVEGVKSGTSISKSIVNLRVKDYGVLNKHISKLANQISLGIPIKQALDNFGNGVKSKVISRAITLIQEAERAGGEIETILESVAGSVGQIEKLRKERRAAISNLVVQGYVVFLIFIAIMLVMQFRILPITTEIGNAGVGAGGSGFGSISGTLDSVSANQVTADDMAKAFLYLLVVQGFFVGLVIGKISEGSVKAGLKHSFVLVTLALLITTGAGVLLG